MQIPFSDTHLEEEIYNEQPKDFVVEKLKMRLLEKKIFVLFVTKPKTIMSSV